MPTTLGIRRRRRLWEKGIGLPGDNSKILGVARRLTAQVDAPVLGGIAVILHGFAAKLPEDLRVDFKRLVDAVRAAERASQGKPRF